MKKATQTNLKNGCNNANKYNHYLINSFHIVIAMKLHIAWTILIAIRSVGASQFTLFNVVNLIRAHEPVSQSSMRDSLALKPLLWGKHLFSN